MKVLYNLLLFTGLFLRPHFIPSLTDDTHVASTQNLKSAAVREAFKSHTVLHRVV
jgi:hypothetical protein